MDINNININELKNYLSTNFSTIDKNTVNQIITTYIHRLKFDEEIITKNYKKVNTFNHYEVIYKYLPYVDNYIKMNILMNISNCMYGLKILNKIPEIINSLSDEDIYKIIFSCSNTWTFPVFLYYLNIIKERKLEINNYFIVYNYSNSDDRIYKYMVENNSKLKLLEYKFDLINNIINDIFILNCPNKYILRRLKYLNKIFPNLGQNHFNIILNKGNINYDFIKTIMKYYYYQTLTDNNIDKLVCSIMECTNNQKEQFIYSYNILKTTTEKNKMIIISLFLYGTAYNLNIIDGENDFINISALLKEKLKYLIDGQPFNIKNFFINNNEFINMINNIGYCNVSSCLIINDSPYIQKSGIFYLLPFLVASGELGGQFNKIKYNISKFIKNIRKKKQIITKLKIYPIIKELKAINENNKYKSSVFNKFFNNKKQMFNNIPPYHLYPGQLNNFNIDYKEGLLLKEKADGVLLYNIPNDIYPIFPFNNKVKAEFIEDLDLYLVFDIDEEDTINNRHLLIHSKHEYGQSNIPIINNENEMIYEINLERLKLKEFLKKPYDNYRWYPKPAWKIININNLIKPFIDIINMNEGTGLYNWIINRENTNKVYNDGIILTPLNGDREIKIKPKMYYTIDLLFLDNKWIDRDGHQWDNIINNNINNNNINNTIWRCYPNSKENNYIAKEIRYDKTKPNTHDIVSNIIDLYNTDYQYEYPNIYHDIYCNDLFWKEIIDCNNKSLQYNLNKIDNYNNILDCGCGSGRIIKYLNKFNKYVGVDIDMNMLGKSINKNNKNNIYFMYCNLNKDWPHILNNNFDLIVCINSIMHFMTSNFWTKLNNITNKSTRILLNIVEMDDNYKYEFGNNNEYFIERKQNKIYYKFPIHNIIKEEDYVDINDIKKYGWNVIDTFKPDYNNLTKFYRWYIITKSL